MEDSEDHRQQNITLAKNLNQTKVELREKKKDIVLYKSQLRFQEDVNYKLQKDHLEVLENVNQLKNQLDETFVRNTIGYMNLSKQMEQLQTKVFQNARKSGSYRPIDGFNSTLNSTFNDSRSSFHSKVKFSRNSLNSSASLFGRNASITNTSRRSDFDFSFENNMNANNTFRLNSTSNDSLFNTAFIEDDVDMEKCSSKKIKKKSTKQRKATSMKKVKTKSVKQSSTYTELQQSSANCSIISSRGRLVKKVDYKEEAQHASKFKYFNCSFG